MNSRFIPYVFSLVLLWPGVAKCLEPVPEPLESVAVLRRRELRELRREADFVRERMAEMEKDQAVALAAAKTTPELQNALKLIFAARRQRLQGRLQLLQEQMEWLQRRLTKQSSRNL